MSYARISVHPDTSRPLVAHDHDGTFGRVVVVKAPAETIDLELLISENAPDAAAWLRAAAEQLTDAAIRLERQAAAS